MACSIRQEVKFVGVSAEDLFDIYMDSEKPGAVVKSTASINSNEGGKFWVFGKNGVKGKNLYIAPKRMIVQTWRSNLFTKSDPDSILTLAFSHATDGGQIDLFHPDHLYDNTNSGWKRMDWIPWREYVRKNYGLTKRSSRRHR